MSKKNKNADDGIVYSTNPDFQIKQAPGQTTETVPPNEQKLTVRLDTKHRAGKAVSLVKGFLGKEEDLEELGKKIKNFCGTGGSVKEGEIIIQGDQREKILQWLIKNNYTRSKKQ